MHDAGDADLDLGALLGGGFELLFVLFPPSAPHSFKHPFRKRRVKAMRQKLGIYLLLLTALGGREAVAEDRPVEGRPVVLQIRLENEAITPVSARFIERAIRQAEQERATCLVILLDTPGGLVDSTRSVTKNILGSDVPVVVFVAPSGARAASAGVFVTLAAHVAAMAPGTNIGAAHPVQIGGLPGAPPSRPDDQKEETGKSSELPVLDQKIVNDTVAWARTLAELRGRNADWAARSVKESLSASASDAVREGAVDLIADNVTDLLAKIDGREVRLHSGTVRLDLKQANAQAKKQVL